MSTAKTSSAIATHLESAITSIAEVNNAISGIYSSVMGRDDARITGIDTRMSLKQELKNNVNLIADGGDDSAAQQQLKALSATARDHLVDMLVEALHPVLIDKMKDQWPVASEAVTEKVQAGKNAAVAALATTKQRLQEAQSVALAGTGAGPISLKIVGVGGLNQIEARDKYLTSREKLIKNHMATVKAKEQRALAVAKVATGDTSGVDPRALTLQELSLEEGKYDIASDGRGKIVLDNKT